MSGATSSPRPPPGRSGLPLVGETLSFLGDIFGFVRQRMDKHGPVFRTHLLGHPTVILAGPAACELWLDEAIIQRETAFPKSLEALFGGDGILPLMDGAPHRERKQLVLHGFDAAAIASYVPELETLFARALATWSKMPEIRGIEELKKLSIEGIARTVMGMPEGPELGELLADYDLVFKAFTGLPVNLPFTAYHAGLGAKDRILARFGALVAARQKTPEADGITRMLAARTERGEPIASDRLIRELHHVMLAGYIIFAELGCMLVELSKRDDLRTRLRAELSVGSGPFGVAKLHEATLLGNVVRETKRFCPNVPLSFGRARKAFDFNGYTIEQGWFVFLAVTENNRFASSWDDPDAFEPDRFAPPRNEHERHPHAYVPQGPGPLTFHKCAGADLSTFFMAAFAAHLVRDYDWSLPEQDLRLQWELVPPEPQDGLRVTFKARA